MTDRGDTGETGVLGIDQVGSDGEPPEFDLTPRTARSDRPRNVVRRRRWMAVVVLVVIAGAAGFLVTKTLGSATDYFYRVDEAVANRAELGSRRFRIQGTVADDPKGVSLEDNQQKIDFDLSADGITAPVVYTGSDPPALFKRCEPVVIVGHWSSGNADAHFVGDQIIIKHTENYSSEHEGRMHANPECR